MQAHLPHVRAEGDDARVEQEPEDLPERLQAVQPPLVAPRVRLLAGFALASAEGSHGLVGARPLARERLQEIAHGGLDGRQTPVLRCWRDRNRHYPAGGREAVLLATGAASRRRGSPGLSPAPFPRRGFKPLIGAKVAICVPSRPIRRPSLASASARRPAKPGWAAANSSHLASSRRAPARALRAAARASAGLGCRPRLAKVRCRGVPV